MGQPFDHREFRTYEFENIPLNKEVFVMDERWLADYEQAAIKMFNGGGYANVGYVSYASTHAVLADCIELSWFPNLFDRFHQVSVRLPRNAFVVCVDTPRWDNKPRVFVKTDWLTALHARPYSAFALVDAIGVKKALFSGALAGPKLVRLRDRIDSIAAKSPQVAFISFADSILLKTNWFVGTFDSDITYSYEPESLIRLMPALAQVFQEEVGLNIYAAITQGVNEYEDTSLLHISDSKNHLSLNSLGLPFAQLRAIDEAARHAIRSHAHSVAELYLDETFYYSLRFRSGFERHDLPRAKYNAPLVSAPSSYIYIDRQTILENLDPQPPEPRRKTSSR